MIYAGKVLENTKSFAGLEFFLSVVLWRMEI